MNTRFCPTCRRNFGNLARCPQDGEALVPLPVDYPAANTTLDRQFQLLAPIAAGGMSRVYRATDLQHGRPVAVKVLDPRLAAHPYTIERFYREARVSRLLDHPNVVEVHGFGPTAQGHHAIVMELLGGESLGSVIRRQGRLPWQRALHVVIELCDALGHAHGRRVVHRDIKPENIQLLGAPGPDERVKLLDFGVAYVAADAAFSAPAPGSTNVAGTPAYMSPEQIRGLPLDGRSDLYALGILLFEMLTGQRPFLGDDPVDVCRKQLFERPPLISEVLPRAVKVPPDVQTLVKELLAKSPRSRVPGVGALLGRLMALLPAEMWPTRLKAKQRGGPARGPTLWDNAPSRRHTGDDLVRPARTPVVLLHVEIECAERAAHGAAAWPESVDQVLAKWRAVVEETGGFIQQPEPDSMQAVFGLFTPTDTSQAVREVVAHGARLRDMLLQYGTRPGLQVGLRACVARTEVVDSEVGVDIEAGLTAADAGLMNQVIRMTPAGGIVVTAPVARLLAGAIELEPLGNVPLPGPVDAMPVYLVAEVDGF